MLSHRHSPRREPTAPPPTRSAPGPAAAPLIRCVFFSIGSHEHVTNHFLGLITGRKKRSAFEKWKQNIRPHCCVTSPATIWALHRSTHGDYKHALIQILQSAIWPGHLLFCICNLCCVFVAFKSSVFFFFFITLSRLRASQKPLMVVNTERSDWVSLQTPVCLLVGSSRRRRQPCSPFSVFSTSLCPLVPLPQL